MVAGVCALSTMIYLGSRLWAQGTGPAAPIAGKVALLNLQHVFKKYEKSIRFQNEMKNLLGPIQDKYKAKSALMEQAQKEFSAPTTPQTRKEELQKLMVNYKRELEDVQNEAQQMGVKRQDEHVLQLYKEISEAASRYAVSNGYSMVLHYNDPITPEEYWNPLNITRKMGAGATMPIYFAPGVDVSNEIVAALNQTYSRTAPAPSPAPAPAPAPTGK